MKYSAIDLFCGCGGLSEGFKLGHTIKIEILFVFIIN